MATFEGVIATVLDNEGGYTNDLSDPGGETNWGICKRQYPDLDIKHLTKEQATEIYKKDYWFENYELINSQTLATKLFDLAVNIGPAHACLLLQRALRACDNLVMEDGKFGPNTVAAVNSTDDRCLLCAFRSEAAGYYRSLNSPHFEAGWLNRAYQ